ncbi:hypothetical protein NDU88_000067 [Pleurodeles waltl]|uniref:Uncharacterized protein n=1 Tax=Pleurodeles waltl TaxID=8319 RepID=A0AAV7UNZ0_PLEWA|nr:hypothetical protein NDU88_000067 [Pleurodeles waltl]
MAAQQTFSSPATVPADPRTLDVTDCILQEITVVGQRLEVMDLKITDQSAASASIRTDIACFREKVADLDERLTNVEDHIRMLPDHDAELQSLREKLTDLESKRQRPFLWHTRKKGRYRYQSIPSKFATGAHRTDLLLTTRVPESTKRQPSLLYILGAAPPDHYVFSLAQAGPAGPSECKVSGSILVGGSGGQSGSGFLQDHE